MMKRAYEEREGISRRKHAGAQKDMGMINTKSGSPRPEDLVWLVPIKALGGDQCGFACEICPLRPWKSAAITRVLCTDVLEQHRLQLEAQRTNVHTA